MKVAVGVALLIGAAALTGCTATTSGHAASPMGRAVPVCSSLAGKPLPQIARSYGCVDLLSTGALHVRIPNAYRCADGTTMTVMADENDEANTWYAHGDAPAKVGPGYVAREAAFWCGANN